MTDVVVWRLTGIVSATRARDSPGVGSVWPMAKLVRDCRSAIGLVVLDAAGEIVRGVPGTIASSLEELDNGNWIITDSGISGRILELTPAGEEIWQYGPDGFCNCCLMFPRDASRTSRGTTLIADTDKDRILEVNSEGEILWRWEQEGSEPWSVSEVATDEKREEKIYLPFCSAAT